MATTTKIMNKKLAAIGLELQRLRLKLMQLANDDEGEYRPEFISGLKRAHREAAHGQTRKINSLADVR